MLRGKTIATSAHFPGIALRVKTGALPMRIAMNSNVSEPTPAEVVFFNGKIATQDDKRSFADALAVANGRIIVSGSRDAVMRHVNDNTLHVDLKGRTVIPGLNDSHLH